MTLEYGVAFVNTLLAELARGKDLAGPNSVLQGRNGPSFRDKAPVSAGVHDSPVPVRASPFVFHHRSMSLRTREKQCTLKSKVEPVLRLSQTKEYVT